MRKCAILLLALFARADFCQGISRDLPYISVDIRTPPIAPRTASGYLLQSELFVTNGPTKTSRFTLSTSWRGDVLVFAGGVVFPVCD